MAGGLSGTLFDMARRGWAWQGVAGLGWARQGKVYFLTNGTKDLRLRLLTICVWFSIFKVHESIQSNIATDDPPAPERAA
jgi:hypothetical protein